MARPWTTEHKTIRIHEIKLTPKRIKPIERVSDCELLEEMAKFGGLQIMRMMAVQKPWARIVMTQIRNIVMTEV